MDMQMVVRKLFAKAASTHSEHEATATILKAQGLKEKLDAQSVALMVVTPSDVIEKFEELSKGFGWSKHKISLAGFSSSIYEQGRKDGREALVRRRLEGETV